MAPSQHPSPTIPQRREAIARRDASTRRDVLDPAQERYNLRNARAQARFRARRRDRIAELERTVERLKAMLEFSSDDIDGVSPLIQRVRTLERENKLLRDEKEELVRAAEAIPGGARYGTACVVAESSVARPFGAVCDVDDLSALTPVGRDSAVSPCPDLPLLVNELSSICVGAYSPYSTDKAHGMMCDVFGSHAYLASGTVVECDHDLITDNVGGPPLVATTVADFSCYTATLSPAPPLACLDDYSTAEDTRPRSWYRTATSSLATALQPVEHGVV
ncbi:hypothetical protein K466DRAFT_605695 [Polyporus arcularius HHB13444]|uniref:BZIP domain-containing protein n=1 Tax=Polyporus arcularius HHB13444 TaxID=1314778 RepID=A0A5C3NRZ0_9APHY|nr:hypothetical protein K466DRAFT_605695 [Polyporus arcularius HHB13444]